MNVYDVVLRAYRPDDVATALDRVATGDSVRLHVVRGTDELDVDVAFDLGDAAGPVDDQADGDDGSDTTEG